MTDTTKAETEIKALRGFQVRKPGNPTIVHMLECSDSSIQLALITEREGMEPLQTSFRLTASTFDLLTSALLAAAHDPDVWKELDDDK